MGLLIDLVFTIWTYGLQCGHCEWSAEWCQDRFRHGAIINTSQMLWFVSNC